MVTKAAEQGGRLRVRSALNPMLWLCSIITIPTMVTAAVLGPRAPIWLIALALAPVGVALVGFLFLLVIDRDKLQSEEYQLRKRSLELMQAKGDPEPSPINAVAVIVKPGQLDLPPGPEAGQ